MKAHHLIYFENGIRTGQSLRSEKVYGSVGLKGKTDSHRHQLGDRAKDHGSGGLKSSRSASPFVLSHRNSHMFREELEVISPCRNVQSPIMSASRILNAVKAPNHALHIHTMSAKTAYSLNAHDVTCKFVESILHVAVRSILSKLSGRRISFTEAPLTGPTTQGSNSLSPISLWHEMISKFDRVTDDLTYHDLVVLEREARGVPWVYDLIGYVCILKGYRTANPDVINRHVFTELRRFLEFLRQV